jgi:stress response protein YsnF
VEREPVTDATLDAATSGPELSEAEHEVVLREEEPVVDKRVVPKERVRLGKDTVTDQERVAEQVRKEQIDLDHEDTKGGRQERRRRR